MPTTTNFIWDEQNYLAETDATNTINVVYTNEPQQYGNLISSRISGTTSYHEFDALGSTRQLTKSSGATTDTAIYDAWGNVVARVGSTGVALLWLAEFMYYADAETSLRYARARHYSPRVARWLSQDPLPAGSSLFPYLYVANSPIIAVDPSGTVFIKAQMFRDDTCGRYVWSTTFGFDPGEDNGFVIQHVTISVKSIFCETKTVQWRTRKCPGSVSSDDGPAETLDYWEMWYKKGDSLFMGTSPRNLQDPALRRGLNDNHDALASDVGGPNTLHAEEYILLANLYWDAGEKMGNTLRQPTGGWDKWQVNVTFPSNLVAFRCDVPADVRRKYKSMPLLRKVRYGWRCCPCDPKNFDEESHELIES